MYIIPNMIFLFYCLMVLLVCWSVSSVRLHGKFLLTHCSTNVLYHTHTEPRIAYRDETCINLRTLSTPTRSRPESSVWMEWKISYA